MTPKEITALRKSGHLDQALEAAEAEFAKNADRYTANTLFWCLNELYRKQSEDEAALTVGRMKSMYETYWPGDDFVTKALQAADKYLMPHFRAIKQALEDARQGRGAVDNCRRFSDLSDRGELDPALSGDLGWLIYYALRHTALEDAFSRKQLLNRYLKLSLPRPSLLHSLILGEAVKVEKTTPLQFRIRDFMRMWGMDNLTDDDWTPYTTDKGIVTPSLVEKLIGVYAKELRTDGVAADDEFSALVDKALQRFPESQNMPYFKAVVLISQGRKAEAVEYYKDLIMRFPSKFYLWSQTAELVDDSDTKISLLCHALSTGVDDAYLGGVRLRLARLLTDKGLSANARYELDKYRTTNEANGWKLKPEFFELSNALGGVDAPVDNRSLYSRFAPLADEFVYSSLPAHVAVKVAESQVDDRIHPGRKITFWTLRTAAGATRLKKPTRFGLPKNAPVGSLFTVRESGGRIVWVKPCSEIPSGESWLKTVEGDVRLRQDRNGNPYTIIEGVYVSGRILKDTPEGTHLRLIALRQDDGRWSAVAIL